MLHSLETRARTRVLRFDHSGLVSVVCMLEHFQHYI